ncbi:phenylalanine--tRNA ligase subunit beta [Rivihabitans pingtungensis]|uniref:Phenylalanine--tRNA ligase beta subunit n=2 Tax=Rivihabitans pingtungensis TaxID=1054498 RepID=A0A318KRF6_9NEIS|nr:phenylalanine--tRNA ligase subunit beta [Rivihabitans pingtungensis]PXX80300.1 phenylalanyl-tRNA synthetase beta subunit [Rivihabitans pingtungensis]
MKFSENWLKSWVNPGLSTEQLNYLLTMAGLEVESCEPAAPAFSGVVIAEVKTVRKHENADRLRVTEVDVGTGELVQIVCGAPNVAEGVKVPCALPGAVLPGDFKIKPTKMRGVPSNGMLCSGKELGVPDEVDGLLLLPADAPVGASIRDYLDLDDHSIELKITPNRADCLGMRGIAREVAALTGAPLTAPALPAVAVTLDERRAVTLRADAACGRYLGRVIRGVNQAAPTPDWMKTRLARAGLRSISAIVDVTNYILLEQGQPLHAFDLARLQGGIVVRMAEQGETLTLLNGKEQALDADMLVIADEHKAVALAGVMGGANSEVSDSTQDVFLESAYFAPEAIAGRARRLGFSSDASFRYERGVDFTLQAEAMERATALILDICGGQAGPVTEAVGQLPARAPVKVRVARVNQVLGLQLSADDMAAMFARLGFVAQADGEGFLVTPPSFRFDIAIEEDLIEEVARLHGYDNIPSDAPQARARMLAQPETLTPRGELRRRVAARDYQEIVSYAFVDSTWEQDFAANAAPIKLINPIASQMSVMRSTLFGGLVDTLVSNLNRKQARVRLFEIARVFLKRGETVEQPERVAGLAYGGRLPEQWGAKSERVDFYDVKADVEALLAPRVAEFRKASHPALHPGRTADVLLDGVVIGVLGELHPQWVQKYDLPAAPVLFELDFAALLARQPVAAQPVSRLQPVRRDFAFVVDESVEAGALLAAFEALNLPAVTGIGLFDVYRGKGLEEGKKSLAFKVLMQDTAKTLTDADVEPVVQAVVACAAQHGAHLRL